MTSVFSLIVMPLPGDFLASENICGTPPTVWFDVQGFLRMASPSINMRNEKC